MKTLNQYINESLLDDEDVLMKDTDKDVLIHHLNKDNDNIFYNSYNMNWLRGKPRVKFDFKNNILLLKHTHKYIELSTPKNEHLSDYLKKYDINGIYCSKQLDLSCREINDKNFIKNILSNRIKVNSQIVKNTNFELLGGQKIKVYDDDFIPPSPLMKFTHTESIENCNIIFSQGSSNINFICNKIPDIKNVKSNAININFYSPSLLDNNFLNTLIEPNFEYEYYDNSKMDWKTIKINSFKKAIAILNNPKKYEDPTYNPERKSIINVPSSYKNYYFKYPPFKKDISVKELFPFIKDMKELKNITMRNNYICLRFSKFDTYDSMNGYDTKDGWYVYLYGIK